MICKPEITGKFSVPDAMAKKQKRVTVWLFARNVKEAEDLQWSTIWHILM